MSHDFIPEQQIFTALKRKNAAKSTKCSCNNWANDAYLGKHRICSLAYAVRAPLVLSTQSQIYWFV